MKILRVFGVVVGINVFFFMVILLNPGCSSTGNPAPAPADTTAKNEPSPTVSVPVSSSSGSGAGSSDSSPLSPAPVAGDASSTVSFTSGASAGVRYSPTRPGSAAAAVLEAQPVTDVTPAKPYTVVAGDNLTVVARKNKLTIAELAAANNLAPSASLRQGQKLIIPAKTTATLPPPASGPAPKGVTDAAKGVGDSGSGKLTYVVKAGETLGGIAKKYGIKQSELGVANNITDPKKIHPGQELVIPAPKHTATTKASTTPVSKDAAPAAAKPVESKPLFNDSSSGPSTNADPKPSSGSDVPVIRVEEAPASPPNKS